MLKQVRVKEWPTHKILIIGWNGLLCKSLKIDQGVSIHTSSRLDVNWLKVRKVIIAVFHKTKIKVTAGLHSHPISSSFGLLAEFSFFFLFFYFLFIFFICSEFCHTLKWNVLEFTCLPHPNPPSCNHSSSLPFLFICSLETSLSS